MTAFNTAKKNNVMIVVEPLANIYSYYNKIENQKFIHVNDILPEYSVEYLISHMLYYALHEENELHMLSKDFDSEKAAASFALDLLGSNENLSEDDRKRLHHRLKRFWGNTKSKRYLHNLNRT